MTLTEAEKDRFQRHAADVGYLERKIRTRNAIKEAKKEGRTYTADDYAEIERLTRVKAEDLPCQKV